MRIGIDARAYDWTGIGRYVRNLLREVTARAAVDRGVEFFVFVPARHAAEVARLPHATPVPVRPSYYSLYEQTGLLAQLLRTKVDVVHFVNFNAPILYCRPFIVTIHDLTRFSFPGQKHRRWLHQWAYEAVFRSAVNGARHIITVSEATRAALYTRFPQARPKTTVIYEGIEDQFRFRYSAEAEVADQAVLERLGVRLPYLLYVGLWMRHKNLPALIRAFRLVRDRGFSGTLVVTGEGRPWDENVRALGVAQGVDTRVVLPGRVSDADLAVLYRHTATFVFPSLSEGFGLPPLEAMASGVPVVVTRTGSLLEILGDAAHYARSARPEDLAEAVHRVLHDKDVREGLVRAAASRSARFSWRTCGAQTYALYQQVTKGTV